MPDRRPSWQLSAVSSGEKMHNIEPLTLHRDLQILLHCRKEWVNQIHVRLAEDHQEKLLCSKNYPCSCNRLLLLLRSSCSSSGILKSRVTRVVNFGNYACCKRSAFGLDK